MNTVSIPQTYTITSDCVSLVTSITWNQKQNFICAGSPHFYEVRQVKHLWCFSNSLSSDNLTGFIENLLKPTGETCEDINCKLYSSNFTVCPARCSLSEVFLINIKSEKSSIFMCTCTDSTHEPARTGPAQPKNSLALVGLII